MFDFLESEGGDSCLTALNQCDQITSSILSITGNINVSNIMTKQNLFYFK
jgi:hypothetical protein